MVYRRPLTLTRSSAAWQPFSRAKSPADAPRQVRLIRRSGARSTSSRTVSRWQAPSSGSSMSRERAAGDREVQNRPAFGQRAARVGASIEEQPHGVGLTGGRRHHERRQRQLVGAVRQRAVLEQQPDRRRAMLVHARASAGSSDCRRRRAGSDRRPPRGATAMVSRRAGARRDGERPELRRGPSASVRVGAAGQERRAPPGRSPRAGRQAERTDNPAKGRDDAASQGNAEDETHCRDSPAERHDSDTIRDYFVL